MEGIIYKNVAFVLQGAIGRQANSAIAINAQFIEAVVHEMGRVQHKTQDEKIKVLQSNFKRLTSAEQIDALIQLTIPLEINAQLMPRLSDRELFAQKLFVFAFRYLSVSINTASCAAVFCDAMRYLDDWGKRLLPFEANASFHHQDLIFTYFNCVFDVIQKGVEFSISNQSIPKQDVSDAFVATFEQLLTELFTESQMSLSDRWTVIDTYQNFQNNPYRDVVNKLQQPMRLCALNPLGSLLGSSFGLNRLNRMIFSGLLFPKLYPTDGFHDVDNSLLDKILNGNKFDEGPGILDTNISGAGAIRLVGLVRRYQHHSNINVAEKLREKRKSRVKKWGALTKMLLKLYRQRQLNDVHQVSLKSMARAQGHWERLAHSLVRFRLQAQINKKTAFFI